MLSNPVLLALLAVLGAGFALLGYFSLQGRWRARRFDAALDRAARAIDAADALQGDEARWVPAQEQAVARLHEALLLAPPERRVEIETELHRARIAFEQSYVWGCIEEAEQLLQQAQAAEGGERRSLAERVIERVESAKRQNHRPPELKTLRKAAESLLS